VIDFDVETTGLQAYSGDQPFLYQFGDSTGAVYERGEVELIAPSAFWVGGVHPDTGEACPWPIDDAAIQWWLDQAEAAGGLRAWNSKFDLAMAEQQGFRLPHESLWYDGMVEAGLNDERYSMQLKVRGKRILGRDNDSQKRVQEWLTAETARRRKVQKDALYAWLEDQGLPQKRNKNPQIPKGLRVPPELATFTPPNFSHVPEPIMTPYAREDIILTQGIGEWYEAKMPTERERGLYSLRELYDELERPVLRALYSIERRGLPVVREEAQLGLDHSSRALSEALFEVQQLAGKSNFNPRSPVQLREALERNGADLRFLKRNKPKKDEFGRIVKEGSPKLDEDGLLSLQHPLAEAVLKFRAEATIHDRYFYPLLNVHDTPRGPQQPFLAPDGRVHTTFLQIGAKTGRSSSMDPNIQNWPRDDLRLRYMVKAREGHKLIAADLEGIEARVASIYTGEGAFREQVLKGAFHVYTADMLGLQEKQRAIGVESKKQRGKKMNYLVLYGGGVRAIMQWFHVDKAEARRMLDAWHAAYPEVQDLSDRIQFKLARQGYIETLFGRRLRLDKGLREEGYKFINYLIQGTAGDIFKRAYTRMHDQGVPLIGVFHDEAVSESPEDQAQEHAAIMETALSDWDGIIHEPVPIFGEAEIVDRWSEAKDPEYVPDFLDREATLTS
jgi:DNA polymerase I-like protein with 3'-5' exonuclease and polymerase domains